MSLIAQSNLLGWVVWCQSYYDNSIKNCSESFCINLFIGVWCWKALLSASGPSKLNWSSTSPEHFFFFKVRCCDQLPLFFCTCAVSISATTIFRVKCSFASQTAKKGSDLQVCQYAKTCISRVMLLLVLAQCICHLLPSQHKHWIEQYGVGHNANKWKLLELLWCAWGVGVWKGRQGLTLWIQDSWYVTYNSAFKQILILYTFTFRPF